MRSSRSWSARSSRACPHGGDLDADPEAITLAARVTAVYTVLTRAEWALAQAARGEGALAGKFRHPAVAPYLRAVQRQFPQIEWLVQARH